MTSTPYSIGMQVLQSMENVTGFHWELGLCEAHDKGGCNLDGDGCAIGTSRNYVGCAILASSKTLAWNLD